MRKENIKNIVNRQLFRRGGTTIVMYCTPQKLLSERHGRITELTLCKGAFTEANELTDEMKTLKGYGIKGGPRGAEPHVTVPIFFDFKPLAYDEPLLLVSVGSTRVLRHPRFNGG